MKKLKLNLEDLKVESFEINNSENLQMGTIRGQASGAGCEPTGPHAETCKPSECVVNTCDIVWECRYTNGVSDCPIVCPPPITPYPQCAPDPSVQDCPTVPGCNPTFNADCT